MCKCRLELQRQVARYCESGSRQPTVVNEQLPCRVPEKHITHIPVLARETVQALQPKDGQIYFDTTFGGGGHSKHLLATQKDIRVITMDRDPTAYERSVKLSLVDERVVPLLGRFSEFPTLFKRIGISHGSLHGVIIDLGPSAFQLDDEQRGFSHQLNGPLDMRMDGNRFPNMATAADVINTLDSVSLSKIFKIYGEEKYAKKFAQSIIDLRFMMKSIKTTSELSQLINAVCHDMIVQEDGPTNAARKVFQALRIFVNNEINELNYTLEHIHTYLAFDPKVTALQRVQEYERIEIEETLKAGKISVVTSHSLEDRIVKRHLTAINIDDPITQNISQKMINSLEVATMEEIDRLKNRKWLPITRHVVKPTEEEVLTNVRSQTAKLRTAVRL